MGGRRTHQQSQRYPVLLGIRDELHEADSLLLFGDRLIVATLLRSSMLQLIHEGHLGGDKCKPRARSSLYWPCLCRDIEETVAKCSICLKYRAENPKEPLIPHTVSGLRWEKVAVDIMTYQRHDYIVVVDFYSKYPEIAMLERKRAACVILHMKSMFAVMEFRVSSKSTICRSQVDNSTTSQMNGGSS